MKIQNAIERWNEIAILLLFELNRCDSGEKLAIELWPAKCILYNNEWIARFIFRQNTLCTRVRRGSWMVFILAINSQKSFENVMNASSIISVVCHIFDGIRIEMAMNRIFNWNFSRVCVCVTIFESFRVTLFTRSWIFSERLSSPIPCASRSVLWCVVFTFCLTFAALLTRWFTFSQMYALNSVNSQ